MQFATDGFDAKKDLLAQLLALNLAVAGKLEAGHPVRVNSNSSRESVFRCAPVSLTAHFPRPKVSFQHRATGQLQPPHRQGGQKKNN